jgi:Fe-S cluster assembly ATP-binding protein
MEELLRIINLSVLVEKKKIITDFDLRVGENEVVALMGKNGSGKTSLAQVLMGDTRYRAGDGSRVLFGGKNLLKLDVTERARLGVFVAWQNPVTLPGVSVFSMCKACYEIRMGKVKKLTEFKKQLEDLATRVGLSEKHVGRNINEGFSGGEKKRLELLQLLLLRPKLAILDEVDSGIDAGGAEMVIKIINEMKKAGTSFLLITHNKKLLERIEVDNIVEMK